MNKILILLFLIVIIIVGIVLFITLNKKKPCLYVKISNLTVTSTDKARPLQLSQVLAYDKDNKIVNFKTAKSSNGNALLAIDSNDTVKENHFITTGAAPWWEGELPNEVEISKIITVHGTCCYDRLLGTRIELLDSQRKVIATRIISGIHDNDKTNRMEHDFTKEVPINKQVKTIKLTSTKPNLLISRIGIFDKDNNFAKGVTATVSSKLQTGLDISKVINTEVRQASPPDDVFQTDTNDTSPVVTITFESPVDISYFILISRGITELTIEMFDSNNKSVIKKDFANVFSATL